MLFGENIMSERARYRIKDPLLLRCDCPGSLPQAVFLSESINRDFHLFSTIELSNEFDFETFFKEEHAVLIKNFKDDGECKRFVIAVDGALIIFEDFRMKISSDKEDIINSVSKRIKELDLKRNDENTAEVKFYYLNGNYASSYSRKIAVPSWESIRENYDSRETASLLDKVVQIESINSLNGRLILFHGEPGTGKTYAIRSLFREWKKTFSPYYILDPENFFEKMS